MILCTSKGAYSQRYVYYLRTPLLHVLFSIQVNKIEEASVSALLPSDDPDNRCAVLDGSWFVREKLQVGRLLDDGRMIQCSPLALSDGDFVNVGMSFDIAFAKAPNGHRRVRVFLCLEHVLQLLPGQRVSKVR
jgi:hypothetical protein